MTIAVRPTDEEKAGSFGRRPEDCIGSARRQRTVFMNGFDRAGAAERSLLDTGAFWLRRILRLGGTRSADPFGCCRRLVSGSGWLFAGVAGLRLATAAGASETSSRSAIRLLWTSAAFGARSSLGRTCLTGASGDGRPPTVDCALIRCDWFDPWRTIFGGWLPLSVLLLLSAITMYKVLRSYSKKAERKHEITRANDSLHRSSQDAITDGSIRNGQVVPMDGRIEVAGAWGGGYSESSSYEAHEHFERKVQRVKKTRGERERERSRSKKKVCVYVLVAISITHSTHSTTLRFPPPPPRSHFSFMSLFPFSRARSFVIVVVPIARVGCAAIYRRRHEQYSAMLLCSEERMIHICFWSGPLLLLA